MEANIPLFAYGSLRPGWRADGARRRAVGAAARRVLGASCDWLGPARMRGTLYRVDWYPGLVPDPLGEWVRGDLFRPRNPARLLALLDGYEETGPGFPEPREYRRARHRAWGRTGPVIAWVYCYARPTAGLEPVACGDFLISARP